MSQSPENASRKSVAAPRPDSLPPESWPAVPAEDRKCFYPAKRHSIKRFQAETPERQRELRRLGGLNSGRKKRAQTWQRDRWVHDQFFGVETLRRSAREIADHLKAAYPDRAVGKSQIQRIAQRVRASLAAKAEEPERVRRQRSVRRRWWLYAAHEHERRQTDRLYFGKPYDPPSMPRRFARDALSRVLDSSTRVSQFRASRPVAVRQGGAGRRAVPRSPWHEDPFPRWLVLAGAEHLLETECG